MTALSKVNKTLSFEPEATEIPMIIVTVLPQVENTEADLRRIRNGSGISKGRR